MRRFMGYNRNGGDNELFEAMRNSDLKTVKSLVGSGMSVNGDDYCSLSILGYAIAHDESGEIHKYLISVGAKFNKGENIISHIIRHYSFYNIDTLARAINAGADINMLDSYGNSPLELANRILDTRFHPPLDDLVIYNSVDVSDFLIENGAV